MKTEKMRTFWLIILLLAVAFLPMASLTENAEAQERLPHNPIYIESDAGFLSLSSGVTQGTGTEYYPFIIENWEIAAPVILEGIRIENTHAYVIIRNVLTYSGEPHVDHTGIHIINAEHVTIENCEVTDNYIGIKIESSDVTLKNNKINNNDFGISIDYGSRESIPKMEGNLVNGINIDGTINSEEKCYFYKENELVIDGKVENCESGSLTYQGLITLYDCENFLIKNCNLSNNSGGIACFRSNGTIINNIITKNKICGIGGYSYSCPKIKDNNITHNPTGIQLMDHSSPVIENNYLVGGMTIACYDYCSPIIMNNTMRNGGWNLYLDNQCNALIINNTILNCGDGMTIGTSKPVVKNNRISSCEYGLFIQSQSSPIVENNTITDCDYGIQAASNMQPEISYNLIEGNAIGIFVFYHAHPNIKNNRIVNNQHGIECRNHVDPTISHNIISSNDLGIYCYGSAADPIIENNTISNNLRGVVAEGSNEGDNHYPSEPIIHGNNIVGNEEYGVYNEHEGENANIDEDGNQVIIDAENNWWNASNGPGGSGSGDGDNVSEYVDYEPWLTEGPGLNHPPTIEILEPENRSTIKGTITIKGMACDEDGEEQIQKVEVRINEENWKEADDTTDWHYEWDTTEVENGNHTIYARAFDGEDYSEISEVNVTVKNEEENHPPWITITEPDGNRDEADASYTITWDADDQDGDTVTIDLYYDPETNPDNGKTLIASGLSNTGSYNWNTSQVAEGEYYIFGIADDNNGSRAGDYSEGTLHISHPTGEPENHVPDFVVTSLDILSATPRDGDTVVLRAIVMNQGNASGTGTVEFQVDGIPLKIQTLILQPGREKTLTVIWSAVEGNHTITVMVSVDGDLDLKNNELERMLSVAAAPEKKESDDEFPVLYIGLIFVAAALIGGVVAYRKRQAGVVRCLRCGGEVQYSKEEDDYYCWECEEYVGDMKNAEVIE